MKLFRQTVKTRWKYAPGGTIWRAHTAVNGILIGEERNLEKKQVMYFALDLERGRVLWHAPSQADPWWVGIDRVAGDFLVLHGFATPELPIQQGVTVVRTATGDRLWSNPAWTLERMDPREMTVKSGSETIRVHPATGVPLVHPGEPASTMDRPEDVPDTAQFPVVLRTEQLTEQETRTVLRGRPAGRRLAGIVEKCELPRYTILAVHERPGDGDDATFDQRLLVLRRESGDIAFDDTLARALRSPGVDAFFVQENLVVYVKEQRMLCAVDIEG